MHLDIYPAVNKNYQHFIYQEADLKYDKSVKFTRIATSF